MYKILFIADFAVDTGFSRVAQSIADNLDPKLWDIHVMAINYFGDYHEYQRKYKLYNPAAGGDVYGYSRLSNVVDAVEPDLIFMINDAWVLKPYIEILKKFNIPIVAYVPVDAIHIPRKYATPL